MQLFGSLFNQIWMKGNFHLIIIQLIKWTESYTVGSEADLFLNVTREKHLWFLSAKNGIRLPIPMRSSTNLFLWYWNENAKVLQGSWLSPLWLGTLTIGTAPRSPKIVWARLNIHSDHHMHWLWCYFYFTMSSSLLIRVSYKAITMDSEIITQYTL